MLKPGLSQSRHWYVLDEEEDEEISAPPPAEGAQEEKEEQGEQQEEGKDTKTGTKKINSWNRDLFLHLLADCLRADTPKELTEEEKLQVLHSEDFLTFFERGSRIVERALAEQVDVCFDYSGRDLEDKEG